MKARFGENPAHSILLIIPYFGKWPIWFDAFLISVEGNPTIDWYCPTDCPIPQSHPNNIHFEQMSLQTLNVKVNNTMGVNVPLNIRKLCDIKPAYGDIFSEKVSGYDFWGICDMDIIWGDIRKFITNELLNQYDIISSRKENISGHFNLFRNRKELNTLYKKLPRFPELFEDEKHHRVDELMLSDYIRESSNKNDFPFKVYWSKIFCNQERGRDSHQEYYLDKWQWNNGKVLECKNGKLVNEIMYLHFINWKRTLKVNKVLFEDSPESFYVSFDTIRYLKTSAFRKFIRHYLLNPINGYWIKENRRIRKNKINSLIKRGRRKLGIKKI